MMSTTHSMCLGRDSHVQPQQLATSGIWTAAWFTGGLIKLAEGVARAARIAVIHATCPRWTIVCCGTLASSAQISHAPYARDAGEAASEDHAAVTNLYHMDILEHQ